MSESGNADRLWRRMLTLAAEIDADRPREATSVAMTAELAGEIVEALRSAAGYVASTEQGLGRLERSLAGLADRCGELISEGRELRELEVAAAVRVEAAEVERDQLRDELDAIYRGWVPRAEVADELERLGRVALSDGDRRTSASLGMTAAAFRSPPLTAEQRAEVERLRARALGADS